MRKRFCKGIFYLDKGTLFIIHCVFSKNNPFPSFFRFFKKFLSQHNIGSQQNRPRSHEKAPGAVFSLWAHILGEGSQRFQMDEQKLPKTGLTVGPNLN